MLDMIATVLAPPLPMPANVVEWLGAVVSLTVILGAAYRYAFRPMQQQIEALQVTTASYGNGTKMRLEKLEEEVIKHGRLLEESREDRRHLNNELLGLTTRLTEMERRLIDAIVTAGYARKRS